MTPDLFPDVERLLSYFRQLDELKRGPGAPVAEELQAVRDQFLREWAAQNKREPTEIARFIDVLAQLPEGERTPILLKYLAGLSLAQISERLGRKVDALAGQLKRGIKKLRTLLQEEPE
jgi:RNA polymerase sigma factor (sigma-70 family)